MAVVRSSTGRVVLGFALAPLVSGVLHSLMMLNPLAAWFPLLFAYPFALVLGLPSYFLFRRLGWLKFWQVVVAGTVLGVAATFIFSWLNAESAFTLADAVWTGIFAMHGMAVAAVFWWIAIRAPRDMDH